VDRARAAGLYDGSLRAILHAFKYQGRRSLAGPLAAAMARADPQALSGVDFVVPVPLHPSRERERGFNQARDLALRLGAACIDALARVRPTAPQTSLSAARRRRNVQNAFALRPAPRWSWIPRRRGRAVEGAVILLVDDVATTGATLDACARALKDAGAREVRALTAARAAAGPHSPRRPQPPPSGDPRR
jgi:ComF family protein